MDTTEAPARPDLRRLFATRVAGLLVVLLTAGCAGLHRTSEPSRTGAEQSAAVEPGSPPAVSTPEPSRSDAQQGATVAPGAAAPAPAPSSQAKPAAKARTAPKAQAKAPASAASSAPQAPKKESAPAVVAKPEAAPKLDLKSLETRLKETPAIGVFTKIALKNQVDDLLEQFRAYYRGELKTELAQLRRSYDGLVMKVLALLQDSDPPLAGDILASREAIWGILSDPNKFASI